MISNMWPQLYYSHPIIHSPSHPLPTLMATNWAEQNLKPTNLTIFLEVLALLRPPLFSFLTSVLGFPRNAQTYCGKKERAPRDLLVLRKSPSCYKWMVFLYRPSFWGRFLKWSVRLVAKFCKFPLQDCSFYFIIPLQHLLYYLLSLGLL